jgi:hypothetical protein
MFESHDQPVRCSEGHLFTTIWIPLVSFKSVRLGRRRLQWCPVGAHWTSVVPIDASSAAPSELEAAASVHDARVP